MTLSFLETVGSDSMKNSLKTYGWAWVTVIASTLLTIAVMAILNSHHDLAKDPKHIETILKMDLPDVEYSISDDNLDRSASRWDVFEHSGKFSEAVSDESIKMLDDLCQSDSLHWRKCADKGIYSYSDGGGIDELYCVHCAISKDYFTITYEVDETEGVFAVIPFVGAYAILIAWGISLFIINLLRRNNQI